MRNSSQAAADPWTADIDNGWRDIVISSAPPPPPREAVEPSAKNRMLPSDLRTWQEHGGPRVPSGEHPVDEPSFAGDRRLWIVAGTLMAMAALVLALLGYLTFGNPSAPVAEAAAVPAAPIAASAPATEPAARHVEHHHAASDAARVAAASHAAKHAKHNRHHKR